ncbi:unnamed protein product [Penicillium pancosmium]
MQRPVTSSATLLRWLKPSGQRCNALRSFSSYGNVHQSSKRDMQTATAYRPHTLPSSFPMPRSTGGPAEGSISADFPFPSESAQKSSQSEYSRSNVREAEAQKSKPATTAPPKTSPKPRRPLRARKAAMKLTPIATEQLRKLMAQPEPKFIRVGVKNRGCSGLAYHLEYVEKPGKFDEIVEQDGVKVLIDSKALFSIIGSEMDWHEDKLSRRFVFRNPNINKLTTMALPTSLAPSEGPNTLNSPDALLLTIRFSASIPDLPLDIQTPTQTTGAGLKQLIRADLPKTLSSHRLRLIYAGRGLDDQTALSASLKLPPSPARSPRPAEDFSEQQQPQPATSNSRDPSGSRNAIDKGKQAVRDSRPRIYIHCSIGDIALSDSDLEAEAAIASTTLLQKQKDELMKLGPRHGSSLFPSSTSGPGGLDGSGSQQASTASSSSATAPPTTTTPAPRGFDRLLSAGFTASEVTALRSQFLAVQSVTRTPDTMPSGEELRDLEDRWMDEGSTSANLGDGAGGSGGAGGGGGGFGGDDDGGLGTGSRSAWDDMLWGAVMGFFWPVGCAMWLRREEGVWSWRKGVAVFVGVVMNAAFGAARIMG